MTGDVGCLVQHLCYVGQSSHASRASHFSVLYLLLLLFIFVHLSGYLVIITCVQAPQVAYCFRSLIAPSFTELTRLIDGNS